MKIADNVIKGILSIVVGLAMFPILGAFIATAKADTNISSILGATLLLDIIPYGVLVGFVLLGFSMAKGSGK